ncbi:MAG: AI-2E family transporter [Candidatus Protochlamydia sp.]|nr:AI-2E family transporter [Candidatus Protochlamydia sp.]
MQIPKNNAATSAIIGIYRLLAIFFVILTLYFAQTIVIPLTLAGLLTFLLSPVVTSLEKWVGRVFSILLVVLLVFSTIGITGYVFSKQLILFGSDLKNYSENISAKFEAFKLPDWGIFNRLSQVFENLKVELFGGSQKIPQGTADNAAELKLIDLSSNLTTLTEYLFGSFFIFFATSGIVILLVIFMLLNREDIRGRIIKLFGQERISSTTSAMVDASERVSGYLFRLLVVNIGFGICVAAGLFFIGIPNAILWGCFAAILRFIPYIGPWIAAIIPITLSFIITDTWFVPLLTISFFIVVEIVTAYVIEPYYYGAGTGVSSFALVTAAIFWTWLWGPLGLLLSTPLTVCLVVIGQHMTNLKFLSVLLSQEQALTHSEECYHRLLASDSNEAIDLVERYLRKSPLVSLYDEVLIPIITQTELDFRQDLIDAEKKERVYQGIYEIVEFLSLNEEEKPASLEGIRSEQILCLPAKSQRDEIGSTILAQLLESESLNAYTTRRSSLSETIELIEKRNPSAILISSAAPFVSSHAQFLCAHLHKRMPQIPLIVCLMGSTGVSAEILDKLQTAGAAKIVRSMHQTLEALKEIKTSNSANA